jgi:hypothetical protein
MDQVSIKYTNIFQSKTLQNIPKFGFLVWKQTIWQPWPGLESKPRIFWCHLIFSFHHFTAEPQRLPSCSALSTLRICSELCRTGSRTACSAGASFQQHEFAPRGELWFLGERLPLCPPGVNTSYYLHWIIEGRTYDLHPWGPSSSLRNKVHP